MTETQFKSKVIKHIRQNYPEAWIYKTCDKFTSGIPDIICCYKGRFFAFELKVRPNKVKPGGLQEHTINKINEAAGVALEIISTDQIDEVLKPFKKERIGIKDADLSVKM